MPKRQGPTRLTFAQCQKRSGSSLATKRRVSAAHEALRADGHVPHRSLPHALARKWAVRKCAIKVENNDYRTPTGELKKPARLLNAMQDEAHACVLRDEDLFCQYLHASFNGQNNLLSAGGRTAEEVAAHVYGINPIPRAEHDYDAESHRHMPEDSQTAASNTAVEREVWLVNDMSAFDSSDHPKIKELWIRMRQHHYGCATRRTLSLLRAGMAGRGIMPGVATFTAPNLFDTGAIPTFELNVARNLMFHAYTFCAEEGIERLPLSTLDPPAAGTYDADKVYFDEDAPLPIGHYTMKKSKTHAGTLKTYKVMTVAQALQLYGFQAEDPRAILPRVRAAGAGDDFIGHVPQWMNTDHIPIVMRLLGIKCDAFVTTDDYRVEFCSMRLVPHPTNPTFVLKTGRVLLKSPYFVNPPAHCTPAGLVRGSVLSMYERGKYSPLLKAYFDVLLDKTSSVPDSELFVPRSERWQMSASPLSIQPDHHHHAAFEMVYGIPSVDILTIKAAYNNQDLGTTFTHPILDVVLGTDCSGPDYAVNRQDLAVASYPRSKVRGRPTPRAPLNKGRTQISILLLMALLTLMGVVPENAAHEQWTCPPPPAPWQSRGADSGRPQGNPIAAGAVKFLRPADTFCLVLEVPPRDWPICNGSAGIVKMSSQSNKTNNNKTKNNKKAASKKTASIVKAVERRAGNKLAKKVVMVAGHGDYRPTSFARVKGRGDYFKDLGSALGGGLGSVIDGGAGLFKAITGMGDYRTHGPKRNSVLPGIANPGSMSMGAMNVQFNGGAPQVRHREYIGPVIGAVGFSTRVIRLQPGLQGNGVWMPWGSSVARNFQQYYLSGCIFEYVSTASAFTSSLGMGEVAMSTLYDANATPLSTMLEINNNEFTTLNKPSESFIHPIECEDSSVNIRYVRASNSAVSVTDERFDDVGVFQLTTTGLPADAAGVQIGELWCTYDITFLKPALPDLHAGTTFQSGVLKSAAGAWSQTLNPGNSLPLTFTPPTSGQFTFHMPPGYNGNYMMVISCVGSGAAWSGTLGINSIGSDITSLPFLPDSQTTTEGAAVLAGIGSGATPGTEYALLYTFSTIGQATLDSDDGRIVVDVKDTAAAANSYGVFILPLDNDVTDVLGRARRFLSKQSSGMRATLDALLAVNAAAQATSSTQVARTMPQTPSVSAACSDNEDERFVDMTRSIHISSSELGTSATASSVASAIANRLLMR